MYKIYDHISNATACSYYRTLLPYKHCYEELLKDDIELTCSHLLDIRDEYDCYIFHRDVAPQFFPYLYDFKFKRNKKIIWEMDDNLFLIPEWSPATEMLGQGKKEGLILALEFADKIVLTTDRFKAQFLDAPEFHEKAIVLPNLIDPYDWDFSIAPRPNQPLRLLWAGSITHSKDLDIIGEAIDEIISKYKDNIRVYFMGQMPKILIPTVENMAKYKKIVTMVGTVDLHHYPDMINTLAADIAMMPLCDCPFNEAKSNIKYLEMTLGGAMTIASNIGPYKDTIEDCYDGILADDDEWFSILDRSIKNIQSRQDIYKNAVRKTIDQYSWHSPAKQVWLDFFRSLASD